jgi:hypothetical protein
MYFIMQVFGLTNSNAREEKYPVFSVIAFEG